MASEEEEIAKGKRAHQLLENELFKEALDAIEQRFRDRIEFSKLSEQAVREESYRMLCAVKELRQHLTRFVETGKLASMAQLNREESARSENLMREWDGSPDGRIRNSAT